MNFYGRVENSALNNSVKYQFSKQFDFPDDDLMKEVINHMPKETKKEILLNVYERYQREFDF